MQNEEHKNQFVFNGPVGQVGGHIDTQYVGCNFIQQNMGDAPRNLTDAEAEATAPSEAASPSEIDAAEATFDAAAEVAVEASSSESVSPLPSSVNRALRGNAAMAAEFVRLMRDEIWPCTGRHGSRWKWSHVRKVMEDECIIPQNTNDTDFGKIIADIIPGVKADNIRINCKNNPLNAFRRNPTCKYDDSETKEGMLCREVACLLEPVIRYLRGLKSAI